MRQTQIWLVFVLSTALVSLAISPVRAVDLDKVFKEGKTAKLVGSDALHNHLMAEVEKTLAERKAALAEIKTPADARARQEKLREFFWNQLGPMPERTPLEPIETGRVIREGFTVTKVLFQSRPKFYVTGAYFQPDQEKYPSPYPAVLVVCGHSSNGKAYEGYQKACALLALNGISAFIIDPIGQGERLQIIDDSGKAKIKGSTREHSALGEGSILLGRNTASFEVWDGVRGIDYLQSRKDVDPDRIGCMGNSGGGTQTAYLMALDERIRCASPSCYITSFDRLLKTIGPQDAEQNIAGQLAAGMDHADYLMMRAPKPTLVCAATRDFFDIKGTKDALAEAKSFYKVFDADDKVAMAETDAKHGYSRPLREAAVQWMVRWLREEDREITEPEINILSEEEIQVTPEGQVLKVDGAVSAFDLNRQSNEQLAEERAKFWRDRSREHTIGEVRRLANMRKSADLEVGKMEPVTQSNGEAFRRQKGKKAFFVEFFEVPIDDHVLIPMVTLEPDAEHHPDNLIFYLDDQGIDHSLRPDGPVLKLVDQGLFVMVADVRGTGRLRPKNLGQETTISYLHGQSLVGQRAEDILRVCRADKERWTVERKYKLIATGDLGPAALHAAVLEPALFRKVRIEGSLTSWSEMIENPEVRGHHSQVVHGALTKYDLPDLVRLLGDKIEIVEPLTLGK